MKRRVRAESFRPFLGGRVRRSDVEVAKNYLDAEELRTLNLIGSACLDFAELQAMGRRPMTLRGWIEKSDDSLKLRGRGACRMRRRLGRRGRSMSGSGGGDAKPEAVDAEFEAAVGRMKRAEKTGGKAGV